MIAKLLVGNSLTQIEGLNGSQDKAFRKFLSYSVDPAAARYSKFYRPQLKCLVDRRGMFPTGLVPRAISYLRSCDIETVTVDSRILPEAPIKRFDLSLEVTPYPEQTNAATACIDAQRGIVSAVTGFGKSVLIGLIIHGLSLKTLIVVPTLSLKAQLTDSLRSWFGGRLVGGLGATIAVENVDGLPTDPKKYKGYDCLILDEFHRSASKTYQKLNNKAWGGIYYRFGVTATPQRTIKSEELLLEAILSDVVSEVPYAQAVEAGYVVPVEAYYIDVLSEPMKGDAARWQAVYSELVVRNQRRNDLIIELLTKLQDAGKATLCLVKEISHGKTLQDATGIDFASGVGENTQELVEVFCRGSQALIGTTGVLGTGVDTKPAEYIILAAGGKSGIQFQQNIGRGLRKYPGKESCKVILFRDKSNKFLLRHFREQCKILKEVYGVEPERIDL